MLEPGQRLADRYRIIEPLGEGGMGAVFVGRDETLGRQVALKTITAARAGDEVARRRMLGEARTAAGFEHPGIAQVYDVGESDDGEVFVVMELVRGRTVRALAEGGLSRGETLRIVDDLAGTLDAAHKGGFIHRDVKPENVMVRDDGRVTLLDFGLAKPTGDEGPDADPAEADTASLLTGPGAVVGTPAYLAPEQACGEAGPASDQWALAVMAWELLVGRLPWTGSNPTQLLAQILRDEPPRASALADLPTAVDQVFARGLAKEPSERFERVGELGRALHDALGEESDTSGTDGPGQRPGSAADHLGEQSQISEAAQRPAVGGGFFRVALLAVGGLGFALWAAWSATKARDAPRPADGAAPVASAHTIWTATGAPPRETRLTRTGEDNMVRRAVLGSGGEELIWEDREGIWRQPRTGGLRTRVPLPADVPAESRHLWDVFADGQRLVLGAHHALAPLVVVDLHAQSVRVVREAAFGGILSHDERAIAYADAQGLAWVGAEGSDERRVASAGQGDVIHSFAWSPDDRFLAYRTKRFSSAAMGEAVHTVTRDGRQHQRIAEGPRLALTHLGTLAWPEDERILYVQAGPAGVRDSELWAREVRDGVPTGAEPERVYIWPDRVASQLSARGGRLSFVRHADQFDVWLLPLTEAPSSSSELQRLTEDEHHDRSPAGTGAGQATDAWMLEGL